jgi:hypothetical protein
MNKNLKSLRQKVADRLRKKAVKRTITWRGPMVRIQDILLDEPPSDCYEGPLQVPIPKEDYKKILTEWEKNFIGGAESWDDDEHCIWTPPKGSKLVHLAEDIFCINFYLLFLKDGRWIYLQKIENNVSYGLNTIIGDEIEHVEGLEPAIFEHTLEYTLRKNKEN